MLKKGIIVQCSRDTGDFISTIFVIPKSDVSYRMMLNLKRLYKPVEYHHFKIDSLLSAARMMRFNYYMCTFDVKDAYYCVKMSEFYTKYLEFRWKGKHFAFQCFPNGLSSAPRLFTKIMKAAFLHLRTSGHESVVYIDDAFLKAITFQSCCENVEATVKLLVDLGFIIHPEKSQLLPSQEIVFLGFI